MQPESTKHILHNFTGVSCLTIDKRERRFDTRSQRLVSKSENDLLLFARLWKVQFEKVDKSVRGDTFRNIVDFAKSLLVVSIVCEHSRISA